MMRQKLLTWWTGLGQRERIMVVVAVAVILLGLVYAVAFEPAWKTRNRLHAELPRLHEQLVELQTLRAEAEQLAGRAGAGMSLESLREAAEQSVLRANLVANVGADQQGAVTVSAQNVAARAWFTWLESFARETRATVRSARVARAANSGRVDASVSFQVRAR